MKTNKAFIDSYGQIWVVVGKDERGKPLLWNVHSGHGLWDFGRDLTPLK